MTKQITCVAVMMLYEEGHFLLHEPVSKFIPAFKEMYVLPPEDDEDAASPVPATRQMTHQAPTHPHIGFNVSLG